MVDQYDVMVIGGGTAGLKIAIHAASSKLKTVMIDPGALGGTCLNTGCIPSKVMLQTSHLFHQTNNLEEFGITVKEVKFDFAKVLARAQGMVDYGQKSIEMIIKNPNLTTIREPAEFINNNTVKAGNAEVSAKTIIISTGSKNFIPPIKGLDTIDYITNENMLKTKAFPKKVVCIGGGYIAMEYATFFNELGSQVTVLERMPEILTLIDEDITSTLHKAYEEEGMTIKTGINIIEVNQEKNKKTITFNNVDDKNSKPETIEADAIIVATGRIPNTDGLQLEKAGIKLNDRKGIKINEQFQTTNKNVYAIGDVIGDALFAHAASREAHIIIENIFNKAKRTLNFNLMPWTVFTNPPISGIGLSEKEAKEKKIEYRLFRANFARAAKTRIEGDSRGFMKIVVDKKGTMLGVTMMGLRADELIHEYVAVMNSSSPTIETIQNTIHIHPTIAEVADTLREK
ncbi:MAG: dihydrolipoyl dehydrogenase [Nanoarchaeota archaeon]|nr:dihydrolipoyl dehydrogenase [Nanoarchaeota archaeon]